MGYTSSARQTVGRDSGLSREKNEHLQLGTERKEQNGATGSFMVRLSPSSYFHRLGWLSCHLTPGASSELARSSADTGDFVLLRERNSALSPVLTGTRVVILNAALERVLVFSRAQPAKLLQEDTCITGFSPALELS